MSNQVVEPVENVSFSSIKTQSVIDWFKFSVNLPFDKNNPLIRKLFKLLTLDINECVDEGMTNQYEHKLRYGQYFIVLTNPRPGRNQDRANVGLDYFFVDMEGEACREFESRCGFYGSSWKELHNYIFEKLPYHFTRYDMAKDDFGGIVRLPILQNKINKHEYVSCFRGTAKAEYVPILPSNEEIFDGPHSPEIKEHLQANNKLSWSATWGTKQSVQFQMYDKLIERLHKGVKVPFDSWIRCEMRFYQKKADVAFVQAVKALNKNEFDLCVRSLMVGLIDFKQSTVKGRVRNSFDVKNARKYDRWSDWNNFIGKALPYRLTTLKSVVPDENKVEHMSLWDDTASGQTLALVFATAPERFHSYCDLIVKHYVEKGKFTKTQKEYVNALRRKYGKKEIEMKDYINLFCSCFAIKDISPKTKEHSRISKDEILQLFVDQFNKVEDW